MTVPPQGHPLPGRASETDVDDKAAADSGGETRHDKTSSSL